MGADSLRQLIVRRPGQGGREVGVKNLDARCRKRQYLSGDAGIIHIPKAHFADILNTRGELGRARAGSEIKSPQAGEARIIGGARVEQPTVALEQFGRSESFLGGDSQVVVQIFACLPEV